MEPILPRGRNRGNSYVAFALPTYDSKLEKEVGPLAEAINNILIGDYQSLVEFYKDNNEPSLYNGDAVYHCTWIEKDDPFFGVVIGSGSLLILAVLLGRFNCVREILKHNPEVEVTFKSSATLNSPYENLNGLTALEIAKRQCKFDIVDILLNSKLEFDKESEYEILQEKLIELKKSYDIVVEKYTEHEQDIKEMMRFVKGESKRKGYARRFQ